MKTLILFFLAIFCFPPVMARSKMKTGKPANFNVVFKFKTKKAPDSVIFTAYPTGGAWGGIFPYYAIRNKDGKYVCSLPTTSGPMPFLLMYIGANRSRHDIGTYYAETGDDVTITVFENKNDDSTLFTGKGSAKYELIERVLAQERVYKEQRKLMDGITEEGEAREYLEQNLLSAQDAIERKGKLIDDFSAQVSPDMKKLIGYQFANYAQHWNSNFMYAYIKQYKNRPEIRKIIKKYFYDNYGQFMEKPDDISVYSYKYYSSLLGLFSNMAVFQGINDQGNIREFYKSLKDYSSTPLIRERILIQYLMGKAVLHSMAPTTQYVRDSLVRDAVRYLISPTGKNLAIRMTKLSLGTPFFDSKFIDTEGREFSTLNLKGKVFIVGLWGFGCRWCAASYKTFHEKLWPTLKRKKDFAFLSVSTDSSRLTWGRAMETGLYTSPEYINVHIGPIEWSEHPFLKNYNIQGVPFLLMVGKDGKIIRKIETMQNPKELLEEIDEALLAEAL